MSNTLQESIEEIDKDLSKSWIELSAKVHEQAAGLSQRAADTTLSAEAAILSQQISKLCDHVEHIHADVADFLKKIDASLPLPENDGATPPPVDDGEVKDEMIQIQRETHEIKADFRDVVKALFMWRDDPAERVRDKK